MERDAMDTILANEGELIPSSGFLRRVMDRVEEESAAPPPIPFPWKRAVPGIALAGGVLGWAAVEFARYALRAAIDLRLPEVHFAVTVSQPMVHAGWFVGALCASAAAWFFARRIAGGSGLL